MRRLSFWARLKRLARLILPKGQQPTPVPVPVRVRVGVLLLCALAGALPGIGQLTTNQFNRGFERSALTDYISEFGAATITHNTTSTGGLLRTGSGSLSVVTSQPTALANAYRNTSMALTVNPGQWVHVLGWGRRNGSTQARSNIGIRLGTNYTNFAVTSPVTTYTIQTGAVQNSLLVPQTATGYFRTFSNASGTSIQMLYDDLVMYVSNNSTTDVTAPGAATCLLVNKISATQVALSWQNGTDGGTNPTGVQGTLVLRSTSSSTVPTLLNQGTYTTVGNPATDGVSQPNTNWQIIADLPASTTGYTDNIVNGINYRYTVVHYDLALNYSTAPAVVFTGTATNVPAINIAQSVQNLMSAKATGGRFEPGDTIQLNVAMDVGGGGTVFNVKTRIFLPAGLTYVPNSMQITDNKGFPFISATATASACYSYSQPGSATIAAGNALTDAAGNDRGVFNAGGGFADIILGELPGGQTFAQLEAGSAGMVGGRIRAGSFPSFYGGRSIVIASIRAVIPTGAAPGTVYDVTSSTSYNVLPLTTQLPLINYNINSTSNTANFFQIVVSDPSLPASYASFGANLFTLYDNGTFGNGTSADGPHTLSGTSLIRQTPGSGNPGDGEYTIAKNTAENQAQTNNSVAIDHVDRLFTHWYILGDHTGASNATLGNTAAATAAQGGYALVVNADYVPTRVVNQTLTGLCPGTLYNFRAWFRNTCPSCGVNSNLTGNNNIRALNVNDTDPRRQGVRPNLTFDVDNRAYYTTGPIDTADNWVQKQFVFSPNAFGDFNFSIRNNAPGGDGNDWMMDDVRIITRGPIASVNVDANPVIDPNPAAFCIGQRFKVLSSWLETTGSFTQYDSYQFQFAYGPNGPWQAMTPVMELPTPNDPNNPTGRIDSLVTDPFTTPNVEVYFRVVVATAPGNISTADAAPCQVTAYNSNIVTIGSCVLPIRLTSFRAASFGQQVFLKWNAADLTNLQHFVIERSTNGVDFSPVHTVQPNSFLRPYQYELTDKPSTGAAQLWYRLKMVHHNNEITYSNIEMVGWRKSVLSLTVQPNPVRETLQLHWSGVQPNQQVKISISSVAGKILQQQTLRIADGPVTQFRLSNQLPAGIYLLQVEDASGQVKQTLKISKL